jgi:hypothetical protein
VQRGDHHAVPRIVEQGEGAALAAANIVEGLEVDEADAANGGGGEIFEAADPSVRLIDALLQVRRGRHDGRQGASCGGSIPLFLKGGEEALNSGCPAPRYERGKQGDEPHD